MHLILVRCNAVGACRVGSHAVAGSPHRRPQCPVHEAAKQQFLQLRGGDPHHCLVGGPVPSAPERDRALRLKLAHGVAAEAVPHQMLNLAEGLLYEVQRIVLPRDVLAPSALSGAPPKRGGRLERAPHRARCVAPRVGVRDSQSTFFCVATPAFFRFPNKGDKIRSQNLRQGSP